MQRETRPAPINRQRAGVFVPGIGSTEGEGESVNVCVCGTAQPTKLFHTCNTIPVDSVS